MTLDELNDQIATHHRILKSQMDELRQLIKQPIAAMTLNEAKRIGNDLGWAYDNIVDAVSHLGSAAQAGGLHLDGFEEDEDAA